MVVVFNQTIQGFGSAFLGFDFYGNQGMGIPDKEVHFQGALGIPIIIRPISLLHQHLSHHIFEKGSFIGAEIPVLPQIQLGFFIQGVHGVVFFVAHTVGFDFPVVDTHEGTGTDDIVTAIQLEGFQAGGAVGTGLEFIKEQQGVAGLL